MPSQHLYPHQYFTINYLERDCVNQHGLLVFHHMGTGKTATATAWLINRYLQHKKKHSSSTPFRYRIICPELIRNVWTGTSGDPYKMGFDIDPSRVFSYDEIAGQIQSKTFDVEGESVICDEAHHLVSIMSAEENKQYIRVMKAMKQARKVLLLTGTPEQNQMADFMYLVNLAAGETKFPLDQHELEEVYRDDTAFNKRKNDMYFNWVAPALRDIWNFVFDIVLNPLIAAIINMYIRPYLTFPRGLDGRSIVPKRWFGLVDEEYDEDADDEDEYVDEDNNNDNDRTVQEGTAMQQTEPSATPATPKTRGWMSNILHQTLNHDNVRSYTKFAKQAYGIVTNPKEVTKTLRALPHQMARSYMNQWKQDTHATVNMLAENTEMVIQSKPKDYVLHKISAFAFATMACLTVTHDPEEALSDGSTIKMNDLARDIGRYVSFYRIPEASRDFASIRHERTMESLYNKYQAEQQLHFVYGTIDNRTVQYYAGVDADSAKIKRSAFRTMFGVRKYGRCISNMSKQVFEGYVKGTLRAVLSDQDGTVHYVNDRGKPVTRIEGCPKFDKLIEMLRTATKKNERSFIRSAFQIQGIHPLSAYLNAKGIRHYYCHAKLTSENRERILAEYNDVYQRIQVDGRHGRLRDYVKSEEELRDKTKKAGYLFVGARVQVKHAPKGVGSRRGTLVKRPKQMSDNDIRDGEDDNSDEDEDGEGDEDDEDDDNDEEAPTTPHDPSSPSYYIHFDQERHPHPKPFSLRELTRLWKVDMDEDPQAKTALSETTGDRITFVPHDGPTYPQIILFDAEGAEGINLLGVEHVHLLEPMLNTGTRDQAIARAVRFQSHRHMHPSRHIVRVHTHIGVMQLSTRDWRRAGELVHGEVQKQMLFLTKETFLNKHFKGIVPRTGNMLFDWWRNSVTTLHGDSYNGTDSTADMIVMSRLSKTARYQGAYTSAIENTNVLSTTFKTPSDCKQPKESLGKVMEEYSRENRLVKMGTPIKHTKSHKKKHKATPTSKALKTTKATKKKTSHKRSTSTSTRKRTSSTSHSTTHKTHEKHKSHRHRHRHHSTTTTTTSTSSTATSRRARSGKRRQRLVRPEESVKRHSKRSSSRRDSAKTTTTSHKSNKSHKSHKSHKPRHTSHAMVLRKRERRSSRAGGRI